ncbi:hypothetical protein ACWDG1_49705 [Streptomyces sp. NPDC001177]
MSADASPPIPPVFDQLRAHPGAAPEEIPGLLERLTGVPDHEIRAAYGTTWSSCSR